jgi:hypothetical protein
VIAFTRTDVQAYPGVSIISVYDLSELRAAVCGGTNYLVLAPAALYLMLRHDTQLFLQYTLTPIQTYPNPYRVPIRLFEVQTPAERALVLTADRYRNLGLYRIAPVLPCSRD